MGPDPRDSATEGLREIPEVFISRRTVDVVDCRRRGSDQTPLKHSHRVDNIRVGVVAACTLDRVRDRCGRICGSWCRRLGWARSCRRPVRRCRRLGRPRSLSRRWEWRRARRSCRRRSARRSWRASYGRSSGWWRPSSARGCCTCRSAVIPADAKTDPDYSTDTPSRVDIHNLLMPIRIGHCCLSRDDMTPVQHPIERDRRGLTLGAAAGSKERFAGCFGGCLDADTGCVSRRNGCCGTCRLVRC